MTLSERRSTVVHTRFIRPHLTGVTPGIPSEFLGRTAVPTDPTMTDRKGGSVLNSSQRHGFDFNVSHMEADEFLQGPLAEINGTRLELMQE